MTTAMRLSWPYRAKVLRNWIPVVISSVSEYAGRPGRLTSNDYLCDNQYYLAEQRKAIAAIVGGDERSKLEVITIGRLHTSKCIIEYHERISGRV